MDPHDECNAIGILLVDDEPAFRTSLAEMLRDDGHTVHDYNAPASVPTLDHLENVAILLTDYEMPGKNGFALADDFHKHHPRVPVVLITAYRTQSLDAQVLDRPFLRVVQKPVDYAVLHAVVHDACTPPCGG